MDPSAALSLVAGARPVRAAANAGFAVYARARVRQVARIDPVAVQERMLLRLVRRAQSTRFGRDHGFGHIHSVAEFQRRVPLRTYEDLWSGYLSDRYPVFEDLTWPGRIPFLALTSGTTTGATKYIPVSHEMVSSNRKAAQTMVAYHMAHHRGSRLFEGKIFFLGGSTDMASPAPGVFEGDLSGIAAKTVGAILRPYTFPPLDLALEPNWDQKLSQLSKLSLKEPVTLVSGVSSCLVTLFQRVLSLSGNATIAEVWPTLEVVVHGGVKFDPYRDTFQMLLGSRSIHLQESYPCSEGFIAYSEPATGGLLRLMLDHGLFYEFVPADELGSEHPTRHWMADAQTGINYAIVVSTCAGMWAHVIGDTVRLESLAPPLLTFTGRTRYTLSAFGEHVISEEIESAVASASAEASAAVRDWHVGPVFEGALGHHLFVFEFLRPPEDLARFRRDLDEELARRNAHYEWFRAEGAGLPPPAVVVAGPGAFDSWMRSRGMLGGQHKVPRIDSSGKLTSELVAHLESQGLLVDRIAPSP